MQALSTAVPGKWYTITGIILDHMDFAALFDFEFL